MINHTTIQHVTNILNGHGTITKSSPPLLRKLIKECEVWFKGQGTNNQDGETISPGTVKKFLASVGYSFEPTQDALLNFRCLIGEREIILMKAAALNLKQSEYLKLAALNWDGKVLLK